MQEPKPTQNISRLFKRMIIQTCNFPDKSVMDKCHAFTDGLLGITPHEAIVYFETYSKSARTILSVLMIDYTGKNEELGIELGLPSRDDLLDLFS